MPWYYIEVHHGGGHQSRTSKWVWRDEPAPVKTSADIENFVDGEFDGSYFGGASAVFHVTRVTKLPVTVKARLRENYQRVSDHAAKMLGLLTTTPTHPPRCPTNSGNSGIRQCTRAAGHRGKCDISGRHDRQKFGE